MSQTDSTSPTSDSALAPNVEIYGEGRDVVFLHGLLGINEHWLGVVEHIRQRCRCLLVELPLLELRGSDCTVDGATQMARKAIQEHCDAPAVLVGNSLGGHMAMRMAIDHPQDIRALVLAGSSGLFERTFEKDVQHRPSQDWIERKVRDLFDNPDKAPQEAIDRAYAELSQRPAARALVRLSKSAKKDHMGERMQAITHPTLLLWGKQDIVTPPAVAEEFHSLIPNTTLRWLESCGHAPMIEQPASFAEGLLSFLDDLDTRTSEVGSCQEVA
ncbi:MAG: alpha/beta fold hydrolase [Phycisphaerales bacterium JB043]